MIVDCVETYNYYIRIEKPVATWLCTIDVGTAAMLIEQIETDQWQILNCKKLNLFEPVEVQHDIIDKSIFVFPKEEWDDDNEYEEINDTQHLLDHQDASINDKKQSETETQQGPPEPPKIDASNVSDQEMSSEDTEPGDINDTDPPAVPVFAMPGQTKKQKRWVNLMDGLIPFGTHLHVIEEKEKMIKIDKPLEGWLFIFDNGESQPSVEKLKLETDESKQVENDSKDPDQEQNIWTVVCKEGANAKEFKTGMFCIVFFTNDED